MSDILFNLLDFRDLGGDASFFDTNTYLPVSNQTVILITSGIGQVPPPSPIVPGVSGNGLTWSLVASQLFDWSGVDRGRLTVYRGLGSSPTSGVTRVQYASTQFRQAITTFQFTQTDIGNLGANAIVGTPSQVKEPGSSGLTPSITVPEGENVANSVIGVIAGVDPNPLIVPGIGFVELKSNPNAEGGFQQTEMSQIVLTTVGWILSNDTGGRAMIAFELRNANPFVHGVSPAVGGSAFIAGNLIT